MRYNGVDYYYHKNHQGSVTEVLNQNGAIVKTYRYDAFGKILTETGPTIPGGFTYTGRERHYRSGLYYYRARFYDPTIGRFITQDPIGILGGANLYAYGDNNPVDWLDPYGLLVDYNGYVVNAEMQKQMEGLSNYSGNDIKVTSGQRNGPKDGRTSQHYTGNAADFYMTNEGKKVDMTDAAHITADYDGFTGIGYYNGGGPRGAHVHADLRNGPNLYWSETNNKGYFYNCNSDFWSKYFKDKGNSPCPKK